MVVALVALFVAMGGVGYAALKLPKNSVGSKQIKKNAVNSAKVKNGSLRAGDFKAGQLPAGPQGATGPKGDTGPPGDTGPTGGQGPQGPGAQQFNLHFEPGHSEYVTDALSGVNGFEGIRVKASCVAGNHGGVQYGVETSGEPSEVQLSGTKASDGTLENIHLSGGLGYAFFASGQQDLVVLAINLAVGRWVHLDLASYNGNAGGCNFWGMITPPSN
ncbi:MAG TPA: hypothetical protein VFJ50_01635 [Gemmatimonadales bacterium]|nr:hypothetical protein [Gemmatimonadales bacterium]